MESSLFLLVYWIFMSVAPQMTTPQGGISEVHLSRVSNELAKYNLARDVMVYALARPTLDF